MNIAVPVHLSEGRGIAALQLDLNYDPVLLSVAGVDKGSLLTDHALTASTATSGRVRIAIASLTLSSMDSGGGTVAVVTFRVNATAPTSTAQLALSNATASGPSGTNVSVDTRNGILRIARSICVGDLNSDGKRDVLDVVQIIGQIVGTQSLTCDVLAAADVNNDGQINVLDVVRLLGDIVGTNPLPACR